MKKIFAILFVSMFVFSVDVLANSSNSSAIEVAAKRRMYTKYKVKRGDSISLILKKFKIPLDVFFRDNPEIEQKGTVNIGDKVLINRSAMGTVNDAMINKQIKEFVLSKKEIMNSQLCDSISNRNSGEHKDAQLYDIHIVRRGESIELICLMYNISVAELIKENRGIINKGISTDDRLNIPLKYHSQKVVEVLESQDEYIFRADDNSNTFNIAMLMPIVGEQNIPRNEGFKDLYRGFLMATDRFKSVGLSTRLDFYGVGRDTLQVAELILSRALDSSEFIVGPVFTEQFDMVASYANERGIPIINPLMPSQFSGGNVIEITPKKDKYWEKLKNIAKDKYVLHYISSKDDSTFLQGLDSIGIRVMDTMKYDKFILPEDMILKFSDTIENLVIISPEDKFEIELLISKLTSVKGLDNSVKFSVLVPSTASDINKEKRSDFYKVKTTYITSSFQDRSNAESLDFETEYISTYSIAPTPYSYRGYEIGMLFLDAYKKHGIAFMNQINGVEQKIIQVPYMFGREKQNEKLINQNWIKITYNPNYTITVE